MRRWFISAFLACCAGAAIAADNATLITPCGTGCVTVRAIDVGLGVQSPVYILGNTSGSPIYGTAGTANASVLTVQGIAGMTAVKVDGSGVTQPVSGTVTANQGTSPWVVSGTVAAAQSGTWTVQQGGAPWSVTIPQSNNTLDYDTGAGTQTMTLWGLALPASGGAVAGGTATNPVRVDPTGTTTQPVSGSVSVSNFPATQPISGTVAATQSGTWTVQPGNTANTTAWKVDGSAVTQPISGTVAATQSGNWTSRVVGNAGGIMDAAGQNASSPANELLVAGQFNTAPTAVTSGNVSPLQIDTNGNLKVNVAAGGASGGTSSSFAAAFPATGTAAGFHNAGGNMDFASVDGSNNLNVNCAVGCAGGAFNNNADAVATSATNGQAAAWLYAFNGTTWDRLRVDGSKNLNVNLNANSFGTLTVGGTVTANAGTGTFTTSDSNIVSQGSTTSGQNGPLVQGAVTTAAPTYTTGKTDPLSLTTAGALRVDGSAVTQPVSGTITANAGTGTFTVSGTVTANAGTGTLTVQGGKTNNNAAPGATNVGTLPMLANAATPSWTEGDQTNGSVDLGGAQRVTPRAVSAVGRYRVGQCTGGYTGLGAGSELFQMRWGDSTHLALIWRVSVQVSLTTAAGTAGIVDRQLVIARSWTVSGTGGTSVTLTGNNQKLRTSQATSLVTDMRYASNAALGTGTKTLDSQGVGIAMAELGTGTTSTNAGLIVIPKTDLFYATGANDYPIVLAQNEGVVVRMVTVEPSSAVLMTCVDIEWSEVNSY